MIINHLAIKISTEIAILQNISNFQILTLNVQKPIIRLSASFMPIGVDIHNTCPTWRFPRWFANSSPWNSTQVA